MDMRTGKTYESLDAALEAGVPVSDIAEVHPQTGELVRFASGPFKNRTYERLPNGQLRRVDQPSGRFVEKYDGSGELVKVRV